MDLQVPDTQRLKAGEVGMESLQRTDELSLTSLSRSFVPVFR